MAASPIHVHVQDSTPVHVHVKKPKSTMFRQEEKPTHDFPGSRRATKATARSRSKMINGPWIPAPGKTSLRDKTNQGFKWDSGRSQLEVNMPLGRDENELTPALKMADLSLDDEDRVRSHIMNYEKKIEELMKEVGTLRNETLSVFREVGTGRDEQLSPIEFDLGEPTHDSSRVVTVQCNEEKPVKDHNVLLSAVHNPLDLKGKNVGKKKWYEIEPPDVAPVDKVSRSVNFHKNCYKPTPEENRVERRVNKVLARLVKDSENQSDEKAFHAHARAQPAAPALNYDVIQTNSSLENILYFDSTYRHEYEGSVPEMEERMQDDTAGLEKIVGSPKKVRFSGEPPETQRNCPNEMPSAQENVELKSIEHELEDREDQLQASKAALRDQKRQLDQVAKEYEETERENNMLRKSVDRFKEDISSSVNPGELGTSKDGLLKKLVEVELDGVACGKQVAALRDVVSHLRHENRTSASDLALLTKERELLMQKIEDFESSNRALRHLLQSQHECVSDAKRSEEHRNTMIQQVAHSDATALKLRSEMTFLKNELDQVLAQLSEEKNHTRTLTELNKSIDATRAHLQRELRAKEMENNRLQVQLRNIERDTSITQRAAEEATMAARISQETIGTEKEALKKATRAQKQRADRAEQIAREMEAKVADRENLFSASKEESETWKTRYHRAMDDRARADNQVKSLSDKLNELEAMLRRNENKSREREQELTEKLHKLTSENTSSQLECERFKGELRTDAEKLKMAQEDAAAQRTQVQQYETLTSELRANLAKSKNEAEEALIGAERAEREARRMREQGADEIERVRKQMLQRMKDLQPLPEMLKETEMKLQDAQDQINMYEKRSAEQTRIISELSSRDEVHTDDVDSLRRKITILTDENRALEERLDILNTKLDDRDVVLRESAVEKADKDEDIQTMQLKLEEKTHICNSLQRQLDAALEEIRKTGEMERDKGVARERAAQARIADLETQITRAKTDGASMKRSKLDSERRLQSQLQDARDRLEQSESTNRSMRNYVNFLKSSYSTVFGTDASMTSSPVRGATSGAGLTPHTPY